MKKMKSLLVSCVSLLSAMTISAQTVSFTPNWKQGDKASYSFAQKEIKKSGTESATVEKTVVLNLKVVSKDANGYVMNATFENPVEKGSDEMSAALFKINDGLSFDYKLDASGKLIGLADSAKTIADLKGLMEKVSKDNPSMGLILQLVGSSMSDDMYLAGLLDEVGYVHSLNGLELTAKKTFDKNADKATLFGFSVNAPYHYTLQSVNGNIANVKSSAEIGNDLIMPAFIDFSIQMTLGMMNSLSSVLSKEGDEKVDMNQELQKQRAEIEKKFKEAFDLKMVDNYTYSFDKSNQWVSSMNAKNTIKGKANENNVDVTIEIKMKKK